MTWAFIILLNMASFGGEVSATVKAKDEESCVKLRQMIVKQLGGEANINGSVGLCVPTLPIRS